MKEKYFDINEQGFSIRCKIYFPKTVQDIQHMVIATYGFGGNKESKAISKFAERITSKYKGYGVLTFDWPCHGNDARNKLILEECLQYLGIVVSYVQKEYSPEIMDTYTTSFGGYITLKYIAEKENPFRRMAFRCPAIHMYEVITKMIPENDKEKLAKGKEILMGFERKMKIYPDFLQELKEGDITRYEFLDYADNMLIFHGTKDESVPIEDSIAFAEENVIEMMAVDKADHPFSDPHIMDTVIAQVVDFFK